jgi:hypothetical protein
VSTVKDFTPFITLSCTKSNFQEQKPRTVHVAMSVCCWFPHSVYTGVKVGSLCFFGHLFVSIAASPVTYRTATHLTATKSRNLAS